MNEADALAAKYGISSPPGADDADALAAKYGLTSATPVDMSAESRRVRSGGGMRPEAKSDEELGLDRGPQYGQLDSRVVYGKDAPGTEAYASHHSGDEMNDPGARLITGGAMAAPAAAVAAAAAPAALAPLVAGAVSGGTQAAMMEQNPVTGAILGALPGVGTAARAADRAIGEAALRNVRPVGSPPGLAARVIGKGAGMVAGGATHGPLGVLVGHNLGGRAAGMISKAGDAVTNALAERALRQELASPAATQRAAGLVNLPSSEARIAPIPKLAPLEHAGATLPTRVPPGALGTPFYDDFGNIVTDAKAANQMVNHATVGGKTGVLPDKSFVESAVGRLKNGTKLADAVKAAEEEPGLRAAVIRDAKKLRAQASPDVEAQPEVDLAAQMQRSIDILEKLKAAKAAGNLTDEMVNDAIDAGVTPALIKKVTGKR